MFTITNSHLFVCRREMFIVVKYSSNEEQLFNPDCSLVQLSHDIRKRCHFPSGAGIALIECDAKKGLGEVIELKEQSLDNGSELFTARSEYTLLAIYRRDTGQSKYVSLLDDISQELTAKLEQLSNPKAGEQKIASKGWAKMHHSTKKSSKANIMAGATKTKRTGSRGGRGKT